MNKNIVSKKQFFKLFAFETIGIFLIFILTGAAIFFTYSTSVQKNSDKVISNQSKLVESITNVDELKNFPAGAKQEQNASTNPNKDDSDLGSRGLIDTLLYSSTGKLLNDNALGFRAYEYQSVKFSTLSKLSTQIQTVKIDNYFYRVKFIKLKNSIETENGQAKYAAIFYNFNIEKTNLENFTKVMITTLIIGALLSLALSYITTRRVMKPIEKAWDDQQEFINAAAHELRTPLTIIQNKLENMLRTPKSTVEDASENIVVSLSESSRLKKLTGDMLTLAKSSSNLTKLENKSIDIHEFIENVVQPYSEIAQIEEHNFKVENDAEGNFTTDKDRLHQLIIIFLDNAIKYSDEKDLVEIKTTINKKRNLVIEISDTGRGISENAKKHIFDRFYREDKSGNRETSGTGLGLSIANWIINAFNGKVTIENNKPKGTIFTIYIPEQTKNTDD